MKNPAESLCFFLLVGGFDRPKDTFDIHCAERLGGLGGGTAQETEEHRVRALQDSLDQDSTSQFCRTRCQAANALSQGGIPRDCLYRDEWRLLYWPSVKALSERWVIEHQRSLAYFSAILSAAFEHPETS